MSDDEDYKFDSKEKKQKKHECIIHCSDDRSALVSLSSHESWTTLLNAARKRQHSEITDLAMSVNEGEVPTIQYHRKCRSIFTMKSKLASFVHKDVDPTSVNSYSIQTRSSLASSSASKTPSNTNLSNKRPILEKICIFCTKRVKYKTGSHDRDILVQCVDDRAHTTIENCATLKQDSRILGIVLTMNLVAAEAHYHFSCYRTYTRPTTAKKHEPTNSSAFGSDENEDYIQYAVREATAFLELQEFINDQFDNPSVMKFRDISSRYVNCLKEKDISQVKSHTKKNLRRKIESMYGSKLKFVTSDDGQLLMYPDTLLIDDLVRQNVRIRDEIESIKCCSEENLIKAGLQIRKDIKAIPSSDVWTLYSQNEEDSYMQLPHSGKVFLTALLSSESTRVKTNRVSRLIWSFGSDFIHAVTEGKIKTMKHIILPYALKTLSGHSVELTQILNRCGHGLSYCQVEEFDTAIAMQKITASEERYVVIPKNIKPHIFTHLAWDNIDRLEETLSGGGTTHRVNGIATQPVSSNFSSPETDIVTTMTRTKQLSLTVNPQGLQQYNPGKRVGPIVTSAPEPDFHDFRFNSFSTNLLWILMRLQDTEHQVIPSWTGFNITLRQNVPIRQSNIGYLPTVNAPAVQMSTVNEILRRSIAIKEKLQLDSIAITFDQALYAKAAEVVWKQREIYSSIVLNLGAFHTICNFMSIIGKRFDDAGLRDLLVQSDVATEGSVSSVLQGKQYNRAVRMHKIVYESLMRIIWKKFILSIEAKPDVKIILQQTLESLQCQYDNLSADVANGYSEILSSDAFLVISSKFQEYMEFLREGNGQLSTFWMSYIDMVDTLLLIIRGNREGNFSTYLSGIRSIIPWVFAYDHVNYSRYLPVYYADMLSLETTHPSVYESFQAGNFSIQIGKSNHFGRIPVDQTIEETVNKDTQGASGTKGFSKRPLAVERYYLTSDVRASFLRILREATGGSSSHTAVHTDLTFSRIQKDELGVNAVEKLLTSEWIDPFDSSDLVSISTGNSPSPAIVDDLLFAHCKGEEAYKTFVNDTLLQDTNPDKFHSALKKQKLKTFTDLKRSKRVNVKDREIVLKADRCLFAQMSVIAQRRKLDMRLVLSYPLGPFPWSLATPQGTLRKTNKSKLIQLLTKNVDPLNDVPLHAAYVIDMMSFVQKLPDTNQTFGMVAEKLFSKIMYEAGSCPRIDVVFDTYRDLSIKNAERKRRIADEVHHVRNIMAAHPVRKWKEFLSNSNNKTELIKFLVGEWKRDKYTTVLRDRALFITCEEQCYEVKSQSVMLMPTLQCSHEEADTRLLLHAHHAAQNGYSTVIIHCEDTDVLVIALHFIPIFKALGCTILLKCGTVNRLKYFDLCDIHNNLGPDVCAALPGMHALTGCDSVSSFASKGKVAAFKLIQNSSTFSTVLAQLSKDFGVSQEDMDEIETFVCHLYGSKTIRSIDELRYVTFCAKKGNIESQNLPPCQNTLRKHIARANYQAAIWVRAVEQDPKIPSPEKHGWLLSKDVDGTTALDIDWMDCSPAPDSILELLSCSCPKECVASSCICLRNSLMCTDMCKIQTCSNYEQFHDFEIITGSDSEDIDSDDE